MNSQQLEAQITDLKEELKQVQDMQTEMTASLASAKELTQ